MSSENLWYKKPECYATSDFGLDKAVEIAKEEIKKKEEDFYVSDEFLRKQIVETLQSYYGDFSDMCSVYIAGGESDKDTEDSITISLLDWYHWNKKTFDPIHLDNHSFLPNLKGIAKNILSKNLKNTRSLPPDIQAPLDEIGSGISNLKNIFEDYIVDGAFALEGFINDYWYDLVETHIDIEIFNKDKVYTSIFFVRKKDRRFRYETRFDLEALNNKENFDTAMLEILNNKSFNEFFNHAMGDKK